MYMMSHATGHTPYHHHGESTGANLSLLFDVFKVIPHTSGGRYSPGTRVRRPVLRQLEAHCKLYRQKWWA